MQTFEGVHAFVSVQAMEPGKRRDLPASHA